MARNYIPYICSQFAKLRWFITEIGINQATLLTDFNRLASKIHPAGIGINYEDVPSLKI